MAAQPIRANFAVKVIEITTKNASAVIGNYSQTITPGVGPESLRRRQLDFKSSPGLLLINIRLSLAPRQKPLSPEYTTDLHSTLQSALA